MFGLLGGAIGAAMGRGFKSDTPQAGAGLRPKGTGTPGMSPQMDASIRPPGGSLPIVSKPPSDMQGQGRTAPDLNSAMGSDGLGAARILGRRGSSF